VLFPIRIDDYLLDDWDHPRKVDVVSKVIGDFRGWDNHATYIKAFPRFLDALNRPNKPSRAGSAGPALRPCGFSSGDAATKILVHVRAKAPRLSATPRREFQAIHLAG
jgi:hypothetical protein